MVSSVLVAQPSIGKPAPMPEKPSKCMMMTTSFITRAALLVATQLDLNLWMTSEHLTPDALASSTTASISRFYNLGASASCVPAMQSSMETDRGNQMNTVAIKMDAWELVAIATALQAMISRGTIEKHSASALIDKVDEAGDKLRKK